MKRAITYPYTSREDLRMRHKLQLTPAFRDASISDPIQEIALRVVVELPGWNFHVLGTATLIAGYLAITAKHVLEAAFRFGVTNTSSEQVDGFALKLYQVLPHESGPIYRIWNVLEAWMCESDIAILHLSLDQASDLEKGVLWRAPRLRVMPPPSGENVIAFGYRESKIAVSVGDDGTHHIQLNDVGSISIGKVGQIFTERRDASLLKFPCFEVHARFAHGMSGGLVIDENGCVCGLVCAGMDFPDPSAPPLSYAVTLWPMLKTIISANRGDGYARGVEYATFELALAKIINVVRVEELDPTLFHRPTFGGV